MYLKLAWRNLWRNKRRTLITAASIFFAVVLAIFMESLQKGGYEKMIENVVGFYTGYAQIHGDGYWDEQTFDNSFADSEELRQNTLIHEAVDQVVPRLESFALASSEKITKGCRVVGIDPELEDQLTKLKGKLIKGEYLIPGERQALVASGLADQLGLGVGDTLVLIGQGYQGVNAAGLFPIKGLIKFGSPELNKGMVYMPIEASEWLYGAEGRRTAFVLMLNEPDEAVAIASDLRKNLDGEYEVMDWEEMLPALVQSIESDYAGGIIFMGVLYVIISFGIFGTLLMMTAERMREFGILVAIGMKRYKLAITVAIETILIAFIGVIAGSIVALPLVIYFRENPINFGEQAAKAYEAFGLEPIFPTLVDPMIFMNHAIVVFFVAIILAGYPMYKISRLRAVEAMRD